VRDSKNPASHVLSELLQLQAPEKGNEHFLGDFFGVMYRQAEPEDIPEERIATFLKEVHDLAFEIGEASRRHNGIYGLDNNFVEVNGSMDRHHSLLFIFR
jgi:hypothetical protein